MPLTELFRSRQRRVSLFPNTATFNLLSDKVCPSDPSVDPYCPFDSFSFRDWFIDKSLIFFGVFPVADL